MFDSRAVNDALNKPGSSGPLPRGYGRGEGREVRPVWVRLAGVFPAEPETGTGETGDDTTDTRPLHPSASDDGSDGSGRPGSNRQQGRLDLDREVIGFLRRWERSLDGRWLGVVDFRIPLVGDDVRPAKVVDCGLVPAAALRPRELAPPQPPSMPRP